MLAASKPDISTELFDAGLERFEEATDYIEKHELYREALAIWANEDEPLKVSCSSLRCRLDLPSHNISSRPSTSFTANTCTTSGSSWTLHWVCKRGLDAFLSTDMLLDVPTAFSMASNRQRAMKSYDKAHAWRELFTLARMEGLDDKEMSELSHRVAGTWHCHPYAGSIHQ